MFPACFIEEDEKDGVIAPFHQNTGTIICNEHALTKWVLPRWYCLGVEGTAHQLERVFDE